MKCVAERKVLVMQAGELAEQDEPLNWVRLVPSPASAAGPDGEQGSVEDGTGRRSEIRELCPPAPCSQVLGFCGQCLVSAKLEKLTPSWHDPLVNAHEHTVLIVPRASSHLRVDDEELSLQQGSVVVVPPGVPFSQRSEGSPVDRISIALRTQRMRADGLAILTHSTARARELAAWLVAEQRSSAEDGDAYRSAMLELFVLELNRLQEDAGETLQRTIRDHILAHLSEPISLQDLSATAGMSRYYFCRMYHKLTGEPPMATVRNLRLERARELALTTDLSLREIAARVGISSHCHLSRTLRSHFGVGVRGLRGGRQRPAGRDRATPP